MENKINSLVNHYKQNISFCILLYIKYIKENKFPYQLLYWQEKLKGTLLIRSKIIKKINQLKSEFIPIQLNLF